MSIEEQAKACEDEKTRPPKSAPKVNVSAEVLRRSTDIFNAHKCHPTFGC